MVGDLLEMSRADAGSVDVFLEEVDVGELVQRAVDAGMRSLGNGADVPPVVIAPDVQSLHVGVDKRRFERVMANLLDNAANYGGGATVISVSTLNRLRSGDSAGSPDGGGGGAGKRDRADRIGPEHDGTHAVIEIAVEDAGPGISDVERTKVFDRFYRGSVSGRRGTGTGTGLGLALVAEHVRLMHGETWVESAPSGGARFVVTLPVFEGDEGPVC
jgi:signal transduction histidine kinase